MIPSLAAHTPDIPVPIPFPGDTVVTFWIRAMGRERFAGLKAEAHTDTGPDWQVVARQLLIESVKGSAAGTVEQVDAGDVERHDGFTVDDANEFVTDWPEHANTILVGAIVALNRNGTTFPKVS